MTRLVIADLRSSIENLFRPASHKVESAGESIGAELEMIPFDLGSGRRILAQAGNPSGSEFVTSLARDFGWNEESADLDPSCWTFPDGRISFEPGGQIEFSSAVCSTATQLLDAMEKWTEIFSARAHEMGIELRPIGIDDHSSIDGVPLQLHKQRYVEMTKYFDSIGPFGIRMMRQTASLQVNVDRGPMPLERWHLLNLLAPYLVAIFANSPRYDGKETGHQSYRAHVWRNLDPRRTGIQFRAEDPVGAYLDFALDAPVILAGDGQGYPTIRELLANGSVTAELWDIHLTTLFPEVRPRDYFEIRSIDAVDMPQICAAIAFICGIVYSRPSASAALSLLGQPDDSLLERAGRLGLGDEGIHENSKSLVKLALQGCDHLGDQFLSNWHLSRAKQFFSEYTEKGRSPAARA